MELARALVDPLARGVQGILVVDGLPLEVPLLEAHRLAAADVDRRDEDHAGTARAMRVRLERSRRPAGPDFSGWNWTP